MRRLLLISVICWYACSGNEAGQTTKTGAGRSQQRPVHAPRAAPAADLIKTDDFEVARLDYSQHRLQRIFVVIRPGKAADTSLIRQTACTLKNHYPVDDHTNISFFSDKKYANYKDELFVVEGQETEYENWQDSCYLGEFEFETTLYTAFPLSSKPGRQAVYTLKNCRE